MLTITLTQQEYWDEIHEMFIPTNTEKVTLEHSLHSMALWEAEFNIPFLYNKEFSQEQLIRYIQLMSNDTISKDTASRLLYEKAQVINKYINSNQTASWISDKGTKKHNNSGEIVTSETIYFWMITYNIPQEYQYWHLSRLLALITFCNIKNSDQGKMSKKDLYSRNKSLNAARRARMHSKG